MMFAIHCLDKPDTEALREANREAHGAYMRQHAQQVVLGGPLLSGDGKRRIGVLVVFETDNEEAAHRFVCEEPYNKAGLFERTLLTPFQIVMQRSPD